MSLHLESNPHIQIVNFEGQTILRATDGSMAILELDILPDTPILTDLYDLEQSIQTNNIVLISTDATQRPTKIRQLVCSGTCKDTILADYSYTVSYRPDGLIACLESRYSDTAIYRPDNSVARLASRFGNRSLATSGAISHESHTGRRGRFREVQSTETRLSIYAKLPKALRRLDIYYHHPYPDLGILDHAELRTIETNNGRVTAVSVYYELARYPGAKNIININEVPIHITSEDLEDNADKQIFESLPHLFYVRSTITPMDILKWTDSRAEPAYFVQEQQ